MKEEYILYIGNLPEEVDKSLLKKIFSSFGEIKFVDIPFDLNTMTKKGYGFVEFEEYDDCLQAIDNMNNAELYGKIINVSFSKKKNLKENSKIPIWETEEYIEKEKNSNELNNINNNN